MGSTSITEEIMVWGEVLAYFSGIITQSAETSFWKNVDQLSFMFLFDWVHPPLLFNKCFSHFFSNICYCPSVFNQ